MDCPICRNKLCSWVSGTVSLCTGETVSDYPVIYICLTCERLFIEFELNVYEIPLAFKGKDDR